MMKSGSRFKVQGSRFKAKGTKFKGFASNLLPFAFCLLLIALITFGFFYGILAEQDLRELKYSEGWWRWQHERALAEHKAGREQRAESGEFKPSAPCPLLHAGDQP